MEEHKNRRFRIALSHLQRFKEEGNEFLDSIVTGDETWVHHFTPQTKQAGMQWKHPTSLRAKKFSVPVCRKSYDISILGCRRCHPC
jgi:hypothetical protein